MKMGRICANEGSNGPDPTLELRDDGDPTIGDEAAGNGVFSARVTGLSQNGNGISRTSMTPIPMEMICLTGTRAGETRTTTRFQTISMWIRTATV